MADDLAPSRSPRPTPRVTPEERRAIDRAAADAMMDEFAALEDRADMDPWLAGDPLARLGYRERGGLRNVHYLPNAPDSALYFTSGYDVSDLDREIFEAHRRGDTGYLEDVLPIFGSRVTMDPDRAEAFDAGRTEHLIPPGGVGVGPNVFSHPVKAHEFRHDGIDMLDSLIADSPELQARFSELRSEGIVNPRPWELEWSPSRAERVGYDDYNEAITEVRDDPADSWIAPDGERTIAYTIQQFNPEIGPSEGLERYEAAYQQIAQEELARLGEPPRAVMQEPQPGNMFYREPEPRGGLLGLLDRIRGN